MSYNNLAQLLEEQSALGEKGIVFISSASSEEFLSYRDLYQLALTQLNAFQHAGVKVGDEIVLQIDDNRVFVIAFWACILGGFVPVPLAAGQTDDQKKKLFAVWPVLNNPHLFTTTSIYSKLMAFVGEDDPVFKKNERPDDHRSASERRRSEGEDIPG